MQQFLNANVISNEQQLTLSAYLTVTGHKWTCGVV